ncbi:MAG TPA: glycosyltransferase family 39 protein [Planctomycetota bacterium]|nr:glycosyltransferase family 39 protein [Planctomycetota bacterium]HRR82576.1 glycosyltransferase family 39 protein [Planctomycetota bacterium]HRT95387.1 glycosyltransferase family 39 protein [Planctomycetota bacterium]
MRASAVLSLGLPIAVGACLMGVGLRAGWYGSFDANGALYSTAARNYLRHGLRATRGGQVCNAGQLRPDEFRFYAHHPPGVSLALAAGFAALGESEGAARLLFLLFTLGAAACLHRIARQVAGEAAAFLAATTFVLQPMVALYGRMPDHEAPAAFFALLLTLLYLRWQRDGRRRWLAAMSAAACLGVWFAWVVAAVPWLLLAYHTALRRKGAPWLLLPAAFGALGFLAVLGHVALVEGGLGELWRALGHRLGTRASDRAAEGSFGAADFVSRMGVYFWRGFSGVSAALAAACVLGLGRPRSGGLLLVATLAAWALLNVLAFRQGAYVHIYYQFYLAIPIALLSGMALAAVWRRGRSPVWPLAALVLLAAAGFEAQHKLAPARRGAALDAFYPGQARLAEHLRANTRFEDRILLWADRYHNLRQVTYYADRNLRVATDPAEAARLWAQGGFTRAFRIVNLDEGDLQPLLGFTAPATQESSPPPAQ